MSSLLLCPSTLFEPSKPSTVDAEEARVQLVAQLSRGRTYDWIHPNFYYDHIYPIGVTWSHAFVVSYTKEHRQYNLHALDLWADHKMDTPFQAMRESRGFSNPWQCWPDGIAPIQAACCYLSKVCLFTKNQLVVLDAAQDWKALVKISTKEFNAVGGCSMNHKHLAFYANNPATKNTFLWTFIFSSGVLCSTAINNAVTSAVHVPEEMTEPNVNSIYFGFQKLQVQPPENPSCEFHVVPEQKTLRLVNKFQGWPTDERGNTITTRPPDFICSRFGHYIQGEGSRLFCFFCADEAKHIYMPAAHKIIHTQTVARSGLVIFQGNNSLLLTDSSLGLNFCIEPQEYIDVAAIASSARLQGVPEYTRCYPAFRLMTKRLILLLPNGSLCFIYGKAPLNETSSLEAASSSSSSSNFTPADDD